MTWEEFDQSVMALAARVGYSPDIVIGIVRGGIVPARLIARELGVSWMYCLNVSKEGDERKVMTAILDDINGKQVLLVEDLLESGRSLVAAKTYLEGRGATVKTCCLYTMPSSEFLPDFFISQVEEPVRFPWE